MSSNSRRGGRGRGRGRRGDWRDKGDSHRGKDTPEVEVEDNPVTRAFRGFQTELDARNDRFERIVKISRDITIESKRVIFLLQRVIGSDNPDKVFEEAKLKIEEINSTRFLEIARELEGQDPYQFLRAYTNGLQEYIEAVTFYYYLTEQHLVNLEKVQNPLVFSVSQCEESNSDKQTENTTTQPADPSKPEPVHTETEAAEQQSTTPESVEDGCTETKDSDKVPRDSVTSSETMKHLSVHIPASEYMLGVADFTGELMRMAITSVGVGDLDTPKVVAGMMRVIHNAFSLFDHTPREMRRKAQVLRQSLQKVEAACYTLTVRGSEIPKHMLTDVFSSSSLGEDSYMVDEPEDGFD